MTDRRSKGKEREELVVAAAAQAIAERGLAHVRMSDVADIAGMSVGHVSYYFPTKIELLLRAITANEERHWAGVEARISRIRDPWKRLDTLLGTASAAGPRDPGWVLWLQLWLEAALDDDVARGHHELDARWRRILADVIRYGVDQGAFTSRDPERDALVISSIVDGLSIQVTLGSPVTSRPKMLALLRTTVRERLAPS